MKNTTKLPYEEARLDVISILHADIITTSGDDNFDDGGWTH